MFVVLMLLPSGINEPYFHASAKIPQQQGTEMIIQDDIIFVESSNNTWLNENLTSHYPWRVDQMLARARGDAVNVSLIHSPDNDTVSVDGNDFQAVLKNILTLSVIIGNNGNITSITINELFPPTFSINVALDNGSGYGIVLSREEMVLGIVKGQWSENNNSLSDGVAIEFTFTQNYAFYSISPDELDLFLSNLSLLEQLIVVGYLELDHGSLVSSNSKFPSPSNNWLFIIISSVVSKLTVSVVLSLLLILMLFLLLLAKNYLSFSIRKSLKKLLEVMEILALRLHAFLIGILGIVHRVIWHDKLTSEDLLANEHRTLIIEILRRQKLIHFQQLKRMVGCSTSVLMWHLNVLENFGIIGKIKKGKFLVYYLKDAPPAAEELHVYLACLNARTRLIIRSAMEYMYLSIRDLVLLTGIKEATVRYHVKKLIKHGIFEELLTEKGVLITVSKEYHSLLGNVLKQWNF